MNTLYLGFNCSENIRSANQPLFKNIKLDAQFIRVKNTSDSSNPEDISTIEKIKKQKIKIQNGEHSLFLSYEAYLNCINKASNSIETELNFLQTSEYFCSMPKKKLYSVIYHAKVLKFSFREAIYKQGQKIDNELGENCVYVVRKGEIVFTKNMKGRQIEIFTFAQGHILGTLELIENSNVRLFTAKSKSSQCIVYRLPKSFFNSNVRPYCDHVINSKQKKLVTFIRQRTTLTSILSQNNQNKPGFQLRKHFSSLAELSKTKNDFPAEKNNMRTTMNFGSMIKNPGRSLQLQQQKLKKSEIMTDEKSLRRYPMVSQRAQFSTSQFLDLEKLRGKQEKMDKMRELKRIGSQPKRQEVLFQLFQSTWKFSKEKRKKILF